jgi:hypothetical protein
MSNIIKLLPETQVYFLHEDVNISLFLYIYEFNFLYLIIIIIIIMSALRAKIVPLLDVHQLPMLFAEMLTYLEPETFTWIIF